ncbi:hypothetical protein GP486_006308 [Trichoglossum hirsutum]|uniref:Uncharacterized protein n=1 Tax=Trichoglossum hirsutum TaxID=265104 RepID=A0A9P8IIS2_9PEZI|nr:hypothetical protein GP486_006308 [Trichoglossum hirsutum]
MTPLSSEVLESIVENQRLLLSQEEDDEREEKGAEQQEEQDYWQPIQRLQRIRRQLPTALGIAACAIAALLLIAMMAKTGIDKISRSGAVVLDCGKTPAEAKAKGCVFDIMNYAWTPPACYEKDLADEALLRGPWPWFLDRNATLPLPQDPAVLGDEPLVWTTYDYHAEHCLYAAKLVHRAALRGAGGFLLQEVEEWGHTEHCHGIVAHRVGELREINTRISPNWDLCIPLLQE